MRSRSTSLLISLLTQLALASVISLPASAIAEEPAVFPTLAAVDELVEEFQSQHQIPAMAVALTHQGSIVHAAGYGWADFEKQESVTATSLFRIASVSKPITAVAILQAVQRGELKLDDPYLSYLDLESEIEAAGEKFDLRQRQITIRHLLQHRGGWDRDASFDPMFRAAEFAEEFGTAPPAGPQEVIRAMLRRPLDFDPGQRYAYSNYGYCLLGRILERLSNTTYEASVIDSTLRPLGIESMRLGRTRLEARFPGEVVYHHPGQSTSVFAADFGQPVPHPYGAWHLEAMDSHGGWIASAVDLAKFALAIQDRDNSPLLRPEIWDLMHERPEGEAGYESSGEPKDVYYGLGWQNRALERDRWNRWHTGSLPGTSAILILRHDGWGMIGLMNSRTSANGEGLAGEFDQLMHRLADAAK